LGEEKPQSGSTGAKPARKRSRPTLADAERWAEKYRNRTSIQRIAREEGVDPGIVSSWVKKVGIEVKQGQHFVAQLPLGVPPDLTELLFRGPDEVVQLVVDKMWGIQITGVGAQQLQKFCRFLDLHREGKGVEQIASMLGLHRSTVAEWREGTGLPYVVKLAAIAKDLPSRSGWKWLAKETWAGANETSGWVHVPVEPLRYADLEEAIGALEPSAEGLRRAAALGIDPTLGTSTRLELFAYLLGAMVGDVATEFGETERLVSAVLDFQLTKKKESNERLGELVCLCTNSLGLAMGRRKDKPPSGATLKAKDPAHAYRWVSSRSPIVGWVHQVCMGLLPTERTSYNPVRMQWILDTPAPFRRRFVQGLADSDGSVKSYVVEVTSVPNSEFIVAVLRSLGLGTAHVVIEDGIPLRTRVQAKEAARLPMFNEWTKGYRYEQLLEYLGNG